MKKDTLHDTYHVEGSHFTPAQYSLDRLVYAMNAMGHRIFNLPQRHSVISRKKYEIEQVKIITEKRSDKKKTSSPGEDMPGLYDGTSVIVCKVIT